MQYKVTVKKYDGCWYTVASFDMIDDARRYIVDIVEDYGLTNIILEVEDGGKH